jgi:hypothetical protein
MRQPKYKPTEKKVNQRIPFKGQVALPNSGDEQINGTEICLLAIFTNSPKTDAALSGGMVLSFAT